MTPSNITNKSVENNFLYSVPKAIQQVIANEYHYETQLIEKDSSMSPQEKIVSCRKSAIIYIGLNFLASYALYKFLPNK